MSKFKCSYTACCSWNISNNSRKVIKRKPAPVVSIIKESVAIYNTVAHIIIFTACYFITELSHVIYWV